MRKMKFLLLALLGLYLNTTYAQEGKDCMDAFPICSLDTYHFDDVLGFGQEQTLDDQYPCFLGNFKESNSKWMSFTVEKAGVLTFTIDPIVSTDDFDFVLFESEDLCSEMTPIRCMASGETEGRVNKQANLPCQGSTGLNLHSLDEFESTGCKYSDDNFLKFISAEEGEQYFLLINNYDSKSGFSITFDGSCKLTKQSNCSQLTSTINDNVFAINDVFPNPTANTIQVDFDAISNDKIDLEVLDFLGKIYKEERIDPRGSSHSIILDVSDLRQGSYFIRLKQNGLRTTQQFVKI